MRLVYIAAPLSAPTPEGIAANLAEAKRWVAWVAKIGLCPVATWIPLAEGLLAVGAVETPELRELATRCNFEVLKFVAISGGAVLSCGPVVSPGMAEEIDFAADFGAPRVYVTERTELAALHVRRYLHIDEVRS
jgi:hypothetical protein